MYDTFLIFLLVFNILVFTYFLLINGVYLCTTTLALRRLRDYAKRLLSHDEEELLITEGMPPVTLIVTAYNEETMCIDTITNLLAIQYPNFEVFFIDDESDDNTVQRMKKHFRMSHDLRMPTANLPTAPIREMYRSQTHPNLWLIAKENGGKADSLNTGINYCHTPLYCQLDADIIVEPNFLLRMVRPFLLNDQTVGVGGSIYILNGCSIESGQVKEIRFPKNIWAKFQVLEYLRAFLGGRIGWDVLRSTYLISGALGLYRRSTVVQIGGYATKRTSFDNVGEDLELVFHLHKYHRQHQIPYHIAFEPDPILYTYVPETYKTLSKQRIRWQCGLLQACIHHFSMLFNPRYNTIGMVVLPYLFFLEGLGVLIEVTGYLCFALVLILGLGSFWYIVAFVMVAFVLGSALSVMSVCLEEITMRRYRNIKDLLQLFLYAVLENFGYRQLNALWRIYGIYIYLFGTVEWGKEHEEG